MSRAFIVPLLAFVFLASTSAVGNAQRQRTATPRAQPKKTRVRPRTVGPSKHRLVHNRTTRGASAAFRKLQRRLVIDPKKPQTHIVVPSLSIDQAMLAKIDGAQHYEQRSLFKLLRLANPNVRIVLVLSEKPAPGILDYYLGFLPDPKGARKRLEVITLNDTSNRSLTDKLLGDSRSLARLRKVIAGQDAHLSTFNVTTAERNLALALKTPIDGNDPGVDYWGTKAGNRELFAAAKIRHPVGEPEVRRRTDLVRAIDSLLQSAPGAKTFVVKLNDGVSGEGNARLDVAGLAKLKGEARTKGISAALKGLQYEAKSESWTSFSRAMASKGAIVERWIDDVTTSPSVQGYIAPNGKVVVRSTHEQILDGQVYKGARYPALPSYRAELEAMGAKVGSELAARGVRGVFAVDTVVGRDGDKQVPFAIEINIREGGTTHPYQTAKALAGNRDFRYVATDNHVSANLKGKTPARVIDAIRRAGLDFDQRSGSGVVLHLMGTVQDYGKVGFTAIGRNRRQAQQIYDRTETLLRRL